MLLVHHMWTEPRLFEQVHQFGGIVDRQRVVFDGAGQHLCRGIEILRDGTGKTRQFAFHRRIARDDRLARFVVEVLDFGQPAFGCPRQRLGGDRGGGWPEGRRQRCAAPRPVVDAP